MGLDNRILLATDLSARSDRARRTVDLVRRALDADLHVTATRDPGELAEWLAARVDPYALAVIAGGDGSLGVAYNALLLSLNGIFMLVAPEVWYLSVPGVTDTGAKKGTACAMSIASPPARSASASITTISRAAPEAASV